MQETYANKEEPITPGILSEHCEKLFQYHAQFEKTLCVKKANKNNIIHIYTSSNSMCSTGIEFKSRAHTYTRVRQCSSVCLCIRQKRCKKTTHDPSTAKCRDIVRCKYTEAVNLHVFYQFVISFFVFIFPFYSFE